MGHAFRFVLVILTVGGAAGLAHWWLIVEHPAAVTAPLSESGDADARAVAAIPGAKESSSLRIAYLGAEPYADSRRYDHLSISDAGAERTADLAPGGAIDIDGETFSVESVRVWQGLLSVADGAPMASVSVYDGQVPVVENLLLAAGVRFDIADGVSLELNACSSSDDAEEPDLNVGRRGAVQGRWGVADGSGVLWFEGFAPGTGATLSDGATVTLESFSADGPSLVLYKRTADGDERITLDAPSNQPPIFFDPGPAPANARLMVCADGSVIIGGGPAKLGVGETWTFPDGARSLRLEQALLSAAPVEALDSPFFEAVLESPTRRVRVRQGEAVRVGESLLRYQRAADNATATVRIRVEQPNAAPVNVGLRPDERYFFDWRGRLWSVAHDGVRPGTSITIEPEAESRWPLYASIAALAIGAMTLLMRRVRRR